MSRSLRSRPLTLYDASGSSIPPVPEAGAGQPSVPSRSTSNHPSKQHLRNDSRDQNQQSSSSSKSKLKKASQVGSNLKKRLSTRYGDDDRRSSRMAAMGADVLGHMPAPGSIAQHHRQQPMMIQEEHQQFYHQYQVQPYSEQDEADHEADIMEADEQAAADQAAMPVAPSMGSLAPPVARQRHLEPPSSSAMTKHSGSSLSSAAASGSGASSSSRKPTLAWPNSSLRSLLDSTRSQGLRDLIDLDSLRAAPEQFDSIDYLRLHLPSHVPPATFSSTMSQARSAAQADVKAQIFENYTDFIAVSSQVGALENEIIELKSLLAEWRQMPRLLERHDESAGKSSSSLLAAAAASAGGAGGKRTSVLSLQQLYRAQLTALWEGISNSQKLIPYKPGRHLIAEAPDFLELNAATYRPVRNVALFLLDDCLLIASRRKARMSTRVKLEAERCFSLGEIVVVDLKDSKGRSGSSKSSSGDVDAAGSGGIKDSIKIKRGKETFVYRAEKADSKRALLNAFRTVAEDLASRKKREKAGGTAGGYDDGLTVPGGPGGGDPRRQSIYAGMAFDHRGPPSSSGMVASPSNSSSLLELTEEDGDNVAGGVMRLASERLKHDRLDPTRWLNEWSDSLAVDIALRRWAEATEKVGKGKAMLSTYASSSSSTGAGSGGIDATMHAVLSARLATHTSALVSSLLGVLRSPSTLRKSTLISTAAHLTSLGYSSIARQVFLSTRDESLRRRKRAIKFEGDTELYVSELGMVVFGTVRNTSEWFMSAWKEAGLASGFVRWALGQVHGFAVTFRRQVYGGGNTADADGVGSAKGGRRGDDSVAERARRVAMESAQQLKDVGLDFTFVLEELLKSEEEHNREAEQAVAAAQGSSLPMPKASSSSKTASSSSRSGRSETPTSERSATPSTTASTSPSRRKQSGGSSVLNRIADLETMAGLANSGSNSTTNQGTAPLSFSKSSPSNVAPRPPMRQVSSSSVASSDAGGQGEMSTAPSSPATPISAGLPGRRGRSGSASSSGSAGGGGGGGGGGSSGSPTTPRGTTLPRGAPPVPPLPRNVAPSSSSSPAAAAAAAGSGSNVVIPSLTLTLADEASGISRRISSAGLPDGMRSAQEMRKRAAMRGNEGR